MLKELFELQAELNRRIGADTQALKERFDAQKAGQWLNDYIMAAANELEELRDCTFWKHWCAEAKRGERFKLHDLQNARVEVIDLLFFWISLAQCVGLDAEDVYNLYLQKLKVNHQRQDGDYAMADKDEADNKGIDLSTNTGGPRPLLNQLGRLLVNFQFLETILKCLAGTLRGPEGKNILLEKVRFSQLCKECRERAEGLPDELKRELERLVTRAKQASERRNDLVHSVWLKDGGDVGLVRLKHVTDQGRYVPQYEEFDKDATSVARAADDVRELAQDVQRIVGRISKFLSQTWQSGGPEM